MSIFILTSFYIAIEIVNREAILYKLNYSQVEVTSSRITLEINSLTPHINELNVYLKNNGSNFKMIYSVQKYLFLFSKAASTKA